MTKLGHLFILLGSLALFSTAQAYDTPNQYELNGGAIHIQYSVPPLVREPELTITQRRVVSRYAGDQVRVLDTEIGSLVTVTVEQIPDLQTTTYSFLIPAINLNTDPVWFRSELIVTRHKTSIGGPALVTGVLQQYQTVRLFGRASYIAPLSLLGYAEGVVMLVNTCPGPITPGQSCTQPYAGVEVQLLDGALNIVDKSISAKDGAFSVQAVSGDYTLHVAVGAILPRCADQKVSIVANTVVNLTLECDSGMR